MNHHAQRLLVAASRGARIFDKLRDEAYGPTTTLDSIEDCFALYIHPDDTHLQYGPIATELRMLASGHALSDRVYSLMAAEWAAYVMETAGIDEAAPVDWLCLFAAELAADEGM